MKDLLLKTCSLALVIALSGTRLIAAPHRPGMPTDTLPTFWLESFTLPDNTRADSGLSVWTSTAPYSSAIYGVFNNEFKINNTNPYKGPVVWTSGSISIAGKSGIQISVKARSSADTGGWLEYDDSNIYDLQLADYIRMYYKVDGGAEVLFGDLRSNIKSNCGDTTVYSTGAISGNAVQIIVRGRATAADEYYYFDNVTVAGNTACTVDATASVSNQLTCTRDSVQLSGGSTTTGATYSWSGPNSFESAAQNPFIKTPGVYAVVVTAPGGCTANASVLVSQNIDYPGGVTANGSNQITCNTPQVNLVGASSTPGVTFSWTGPNGFIASGAVVPITAGGTYALTVTNPTNGCAKILPAIVAQNKTLPANVTATNSGPLTCTVSNVDIIGSSTDANVDYEWSGPDGFQSYSASDIVTTPGEYVLTVTNSSNGCYVTQSTIVANNCSGQRRITPAAIPGVDTLSSGFEWSVYPNPVNDKAVVEFKLPESNFVKLQVYNNNGIAEKLLFNARVTPNQLYRLSLSGGLPAGMHYIVVQVNNKLFTKKLLFVK